jgi:hypothetical protein
MAIDVKKKKQPGFLVPPTRGEAPPGERLVPPSVTAYEEEPGGRTGDTSVPSPYDWYTPPAYLDTSLVPPGNTAPSDVYGARAEAAGRVLDTQQQDPWTGADPEQAVAGAVPSPLVPVSSLAEPRAEAASRIIPVPTSETADSPYAPPVAPAAGKAKESQADPYERGVVHPHSTYHDIPLLPEGAGEGAEENLGGLIEPLEPPDPEGPLEPKKNLQKQNVWTTPSGDMKF